MKLRLYMSSAVFCIDNTQFTHFTLKSYVACLQGFGTANGAALHLLQGVPTRDCHSGLDGKHKP